jgi:leucyl-tRNA synthetase
MKFNTAIATLMALVNDFNRVGTITIGEFKTFIHLLNPFAPHLTEELWQKHEFGGEIAYATWPEYDEDKTVDDQIEIVLQVCGKVKTKMMIPAGLDRQAMEDFVKQS